MDWLFYALLAPMVWALLNILDKIIVTKYIKNPMTNIIIGSLFRIPFTLLLFSIFQVPFSLPWSILALILGILEVTSWIFYLKAMLAEEASKVVPLLYLYPIFTVVLASLFLGEVLDLEKYIGILLLVSSTILLTVQRIEGTWKHSPALKMILLTSLLWGIGSTGSKYVLGYMDYISFTLWMIIGIVIGGLSFLLFPRMRKNFLQEFPSIDKRAFIITFFVIIMFLIGIFSYNNAASLGPISLVSAVGSIQPLFVLIFAILFTKFAPQIVTEKINKSTIFLKLLAILLIMVGMWLITS